MVGVQEFTRSTLSVMTTTRRRPGRPRGGHVVADRTQMLAAAATVIRASGPDVTMDEIAAGASVTKPILYRTIGDKAALMQALSESLIDEWDAAVMAASSRVTDPRAAFEASVRQYLRSVDADRNLYLFVTSGAPGTEPYRSLVDRSSRSMVALYTDARTAVGLDPSGARTWAWAIVGALQIVTTMWFRDDDLDPDDIAHDITDLLWAGLGPTLGSRR
jgi:AcrR family transcriptional regulator